ncbi:NAD(P)H-binding protein [Flavobacterium foetidum]|uniref:NAD(P)H-binding protein n=1 Tax=Flavobacterium foetidum TaxID=2026681 RepID=UPI001075891F|nr:NAD(P)H-binding protein [Flavobacterium foetidum]KAF2508083.1 NAD(P)H-binding protein [Flavobacterium foetidum]
MKALVIGATGATGRFLVDELLADPFYTTVVIFVRKPTGRQNPKLVEHIIDFTAIRDSKDLIVGDVIFSCLGTTLKDAGSKESQTKIDFDMPLQFAEIAKANGINSFILLSAYGASAKSNVFYSQLKGKLEDKIAALHFEQYIVFRPGLLLRPDSDRAGEKISAVVLSVFNSLGLFRKFKPLPTAVLAQKLAISPRLFSRGNSIVELNKIFELNL